MQENLRIIPIPLGSSLLLFAEECVSTFSALMAVARNAVPVGETIDISMLARSGAW